MRCGVVLSHPSLLAQVSSARLRQGEALGPLPCCGHTQESTSLQAYLLGSADQRAQNRQEAEKPVQFHMSELDPIVTIF